MEVGTDRGKEAILLGNTGIFFVLIRSMTTGMDFDGRAAKLLEFVKQRTKLQVAVMIATGVSNHGNTIGTTNPVDRFGQCGPAMRHVAWLAFAQIFAEHFLSVNAIAGFDQKTCKMRARYQIRIADMLERSLKGT